MTKEPKTGGDCHEAAAKLLLELTEKGMDAVMVQAVVINSLDNKPMSHSWVEFGESNRFVLDFSNNERHCFPKDLYYEVAKIQDRIEYTREQVIDKMLTTGKYQLWDLQCDR